MNFDEYAEKAKETAIYKEALTGSQKATSYVGLGLASEAGEIAGKLKKVLRDTEDGQMTEERKLDLAYEIGDVLWYSALLSLELGISLGAIAEANIDKLFGRKSRGTLGGSGDKR